jgi:hypothetical protein
MKQKKIVPITSHACTFTVFLEKTYTKLEAGNHYKQTSNKSIFISILTPFFDHWVYV